MVKSQKIGVQKKILHVAVEEKKPGCIQLQEPKGLGFLEARMEGIIQNSGHCPPKKGKGEVKTHPAMQGFTTLTCKPFLSYCRMDPKEIRE